jgi:hypothetical protein
MRYALGCLACRLGLRKLGLMRSAGRLWVLASLSCAACFVAAGGASADILAGPDATKVCAGYKGGGISWSISLNEGWRPSSFIRYRVILRDPANRVIGYQESSRLAGGWLGPYPYWDNGAVTSDPVVGTNSLGEPTPGIYPFTLQLRVDSRYPDIGAIGLHNFDWPTHANQWITHTWNIHVYACR